MACKHKTQHDHSGASYTGVRIWRCSVCGLNQPWGPSWGYIGNLECKRCGWAKIEAVFCSDACADSLRKKPRFAKLPTFD